MAEKPDSDYTDDLAVTMYRNSRKKHLTDFTIVIGNMYVFCHAVVLCAKSEYFDSLVSSGVHTANLDEFVLSKDGAIVQDIVRFLYVGIIDLTTDTVVTVLRAGTFIKVRQLISRCEAYMLATLSLETFRSYSDAVEKFGLRDLGAACQEFPVKNFSALVATPWFIPSLSLQQLADYLAHDARQVAREDDALEAVRKWLEVNKNHEEDDVDTLMQHVRLSSCDPRRLNELQKDKSVPMALRMKLLEYQAEGGKDRGEKTRAGGSTTPSSTAGASAQKKDQYQAEGGKDRGEKTRAGGSTTPSSTAGASAQKKVVLVGRQTTGGRSDQITYLDEQHQNIPITTAEGYTDLDDYSVSFHGNNITISGGYSYAKKESVDTINQYDTITRHWRKLPNLQQKTCQHVSLIVQHFLFIIAGVLESPANTYKKWYKDVAILDLLTGKWRKGAEIPHAVRHAGAAVVNGNIVVAGGDDSDGKYTTRTVKYDPEADRWSDCTSMPKSRDVSFNSTVSVGNLMYVLARNDFLEYNITSDQWTILTAPPVPSYRSAMLVHDDHTLLAVGGWKDGTTHGRIQRYDLRTRQWSLCDEKMSRPLFNHFACLLPLPQ